MILFEAAVFVIEYNDFCWETVFLIGSEMRHSYLTNQGSYYVL